MRFVCLVVVVLLLFATFGSALSPFLAENSRIGVRINTSIDLIPTSSDFSIDYVKANFSFVPSDYENQDVISFSSSPEAVSIPNGVELAWQKPGAGTLNGNINVIVDVVPWQPKVRQKVDFPLRSIPDNLVQYTLPSEKIDSDSRDIVVLASQLAEDEDDEYRVVFKIANWTQKNIEYNLSTLTADVSQKASWVMKNKQGVCDEITVLFIAMLRSLGIPARFVSGVVYTDSPLFEKSWGAHGWAEVYFPGYGWVPFDVTYGEFGYIDATHVKSMDSIDPDQNSVFYQWRGRNIDLKGAEPSIDATLLSSEGIVNPDVEISARVIEDEVGFGSYDLAELSIKNIRDFYVAVEVIAGRTEGLVVDNPVRQVLLAPGELRREYYYLNVDSGLNQRYIYTFPVHFYGTRNVSSSTSFKASSKADEFDRDYFNQFIVPNSEIKNPQPGLSLICFPDKRQYYVYETSSVNCTVKNSGNRYLNDVSVCLDNCASFSLQISGRESVDFQKKLRLGQNIFTIRASAPSVSESFAVNIRAVDIPDLEISNISVPGSVAYSQPFNMSFELIRNSSSIPVNAVVKVYDESYNLNLTDARRRLIFPFMGSEFQEGNNTVTITLKYEDLNGRAYSKEANATILVEKMSFWQKILSFFRALFS